MNTNNNPPYQEVSKALDETKLFIREIVSIITSYVTKEPGHTLFFGDIDQFQLILDEFGSVPLTLLTKQQRSLKIPLRDSMKHCTMSDIDFPNFLRRATSFNAIECMKETILSADLAITTMIFHLDSFEQSPKDLNTMSKWLRWNVAALTCTVCNIIINYQNRSTSFSSTTCLFKNGADFDSFFQVIYIYL